MAGPPAEWLAVGLVRKPHGIHGEVAVEVLTDFPDRLEAGMEVRLGAEPGCVLHLERVRWHKGAWLLTFAGVEDRNEVETWRNLYLYLPAQERSGLPERYYYEHELAGLECVLPDGTALGRVKALTDAPGSALLDVDTNHGGVLVPFRSPIVVRVELDAGRVVLDPPTGLFDDDEAL